MLLVFSSHFPNEVDFQFIRPPAGLSGFARERETRGVCGGVAVGALDKMKYLVYLNAIEIG